MFNISNYDRSRFFRLNHKNFSAYCYEREVILPEGLPCDILNIEDYEIDPEKNKLFKGFEGCKILTVIYVFVSQWLLIMSIEL